MKPRKYEFQQRPNGRGAVVRVGPKGARTMIAVYSSQATAESIVQRLNSAIHLEV